MKNEKAFAEAAARQVIRQAQASARVVDQMMRVWEAMERLNATLQPPGERGKEG